MTWTRSRASGHWIDYPDTTYGLVGAVEFENWDAGLDAVYNGSLPGPLTIAHSGNSTKALYVTQSQSDGTVSAYKPIQLYAEYTGTNAASASTVVSEGLTSTVYYGGSGTPTEALGTVQAVSSEIVVRGSASQTNEYTPFFSVVRADIGTGYSSSSTTPGRYWGTDQSVHGPIAVQPGLLNGVTSFVNNYYNGSPSSQPSAAAWFVTRNGSGGGLDSFHTSAVTYPLDQMVGIVGTSGSGNTGRGATVGLKVGGTGSGWASASLFGTGVEIRDWEDYGFRVTNRAASGTGPALSVANNAGPVVIGGDAVTNSVTLLEVVAGSGQRDPMMMVQSTATSAISFTFKNASGGQSLFAAGGASSFLTGTVAGDIGIKVLGSGKKWHVGGSTIVQTISVDNKLSWFGVAPVTQQTRPVVLADVINLLVAYGLSA